MIVFISELTRLIKEVRALNLSEAEFKATMIGCTMTITSSKDFTDEQKEAAKLILLAAVR